MYCAHSHVCSVHVFNIYPEATISVMFGDTHVLFSDLGSSRSVMSGGTHVLFSDLGSSRSFHKDPFTNLPDEADPDEADEDPWDRSEVPNMDAFQCLRKLKKVKQISQTVEGEAARYSQGSTSVER